MIIKSITTFLLVYFCFLASAVAGGKTMPPSSVDNVLPLSNIQQIILPGIDNDKVQAEDIQRKSEGLAPRYAIPVPCDYTPLDSGTWETMGNGKRLWRLRVRSEGATSLNFGFTQYFMPEGGELYVYSTDRSSMRGPYTDRDNEVHGELWTPVVLGDSAVIELVIPSEVTDLLKLRLTSINHGYGEYFVPDKIKSGTCNVDVVCSEGNNWRDEIRSVGVISTDGSLFCSGFMVNNTAEDFTPYFMTANHCGITSGNAASLVVYWNFETTSCGGSPNGTLDDNQTGAIFRAARATSDFTLVELDDAPDPTFNVYWAGWDNSNADPTRAVGIHHPNTDEKRISFENNALNTTGYLGDAFGDGSHLKVIDWDIGTTEPGSSGSGLWNQNHHIVGQLHGGYAACGNDLADWYGRFSVSWDVGSSSSTRLRDWLDPGNTGTVTLDGIDGSTTPICPTLPSNGIMDNGSQWTSKTGTWNSSSGVNPYGGGSLYSNTSGTYEYCATGVSGSKEVSLWWTEYSSRCTSVQVGIYDGNTSIDTVYVNHKADGGKWNLLGTYTFSGKAKVVINSGGGCTTSADACKISAAGTGGCFADPKFQIGTCNNGNQYYTDRSYTLTDVGPFAGMDMIKTLNDDRNNTMSSDYLKFTTNLSGWVYVAYDRRATTPPNWLTSTFTKIDCKIYTSLSSQGWLDVYKRAVEEGECVNLGGNRGPGFSGGTVSNFIVLESSENVGDECDGHVECTLDSKFNRVTYTGIGQTYYTDRAYTITSHSIGNEEWIIKTPNDERNNTQSSGYMKFEMPFDGYVDIAFDSRLTTLPTWASGFTKEDGWYTPPWAANLLCRYTHITIAWESALNWEATRLPGQAQAQPAII